MSSPSPTHDGPLGDTAASAALHPAEPSRPPGVAPHPGRAVAISLLVLAFDFAMLAIGTGGVAPLIHHARAMALLATWLVAYPALALLRPVRSSDTVVRQPDPFLMTVLFAIPLVTPLLSALAERHGLWLLPGGMALRWAGVIVAAAGFALRVAAMRKLGSRFSPLVAIQRQHALETHGVYAHMRHPGYLGSWLCNLGIVLAFGSGATLVLAGLMALALAARIAREERLMEESFGDAWRAYRERAGRYLPRV